MSSSSVPFLSFTWNQEFFTPVLIMFLCFATAYIIFMNFLYKKLLKTLKRGNVFIVMYHINRKRFTYLTKAKQQLLFRSLRFKTFDDFLSQFMEGERDGIKLAFASLKKQSRPISIKLTTKREKRCFHLNAHRLTSKSKWAVIILNDISQQEQESTSLRLECKMLTSSVTNYKKAFDHLPIPIWIRQDHELLYVNPKCANMFYDSSKLSSPSNAPQIFVRDLRCLTDKNTLPIPLIDEGKRQFYSFHEAHSSKNQGRAITVGFGHDETKTIEKEKEVKYQASAYTKVLETLSAGVSIYDHNQRLIYFNQAYQHMFDFEPDWLIKTPTLGDVLDNLRSRRLLPEQAEYSLYKQEQIRMLKTLMHEFENLNHLPDGRIIREILAPHPLGGCFYIFEDVTDRINLEQKHNTQLAVQKATLDNLFEGIAVFGPDHRLQFTNRAFFDLWHIDKDRLTPGQHLSDVAEMARKYLENQNDWKRYKNRVMQIVTDRIPKHRLIRRNDNSTLEFSYIPLPDGSHMMSYRDITDRIELKTAYEERIKAQKESEQLKSEFISNMSFEMRSPLSTIIGYTDLLLNSVSSQHTLSAEQLSYCRDIHVSSTQLLNLVNNILDLAMIESGHIKLNKTSQNFWDLFKDTIDRYNQQIDPELSPISITFPESVAMIKADKKYLSKALETLLINTSSFYNEGKPVSLDLEENPLTQTITLILTMENSAIDYNAVIGIDTKQKNPKALARSLVDYVFKEHRATLYESTTNEKKEITIIFPIEPAYKAIHTSELAKKDQLDWERDGLKTPDSNVIDSRRSTDAA